MKNKMIAGLLLWISMWGVTASAAQSAITCDRECLRGKVTQLLYAFLKHDVSKLPVAGTLRVTEDAVEKRRHVRGHGRFHPAISRTLAGRQAGGHHARPCQRE